MTGPATDNPERWPEAMRPAPLTEPITTQIYGGKAAQLSAATRAGLSVPPGFALSVAFVDAIAAGWSEAVQELDAAVRRLGGPVAVRSSAIGEDSAQASFAGQHLSLLNLRSTEAVAAAVTAIRQSAREPSALAYRERMGLPPEPQVAVVIQGLIDPEVSGVLFSRNPVTGAREWVIEAAWGLGEAVVAGLVTPDLFRLAPDGSVLERTPGRKDVAVRVDPAGGTHQVAVAGDQTSSLCLDDVQLAALRELARRCDAVFAGDHDIEWAFADGRLFLLQRRALTA